MARFWAVIVDAVLQQIKGLVPKPTPVAVFPIVNLSQLKSFQNSLLPNSGLLPRYMVLSYLLRIPLLLGMLKNFHLRFLSELRKSRKSRRRESTDLVRGL